MKDKTFPYTKNASKKENDSIAKYGGLYSGKSNKNVRSSDFLIFKFGVIIVAYSFTMGLSPIICTEL